MEPDAVRTVERVPHGSTSDHTVLDFSANINPRRPPGVGQAYDSALAASRRYPDDEYAEYRRAAAEYVGCEPRRVVPTPGGLAAIRLAMETTLRPGDRVLLPSPSFGEYAREVRLQGAEPVFVPYDELVGTCPAEYALAVLCNPNNPTGDAYDQDRLETYVERVRETGTPLLVDEAFLGFTDHPSLAGTEGVIVARSLTKLFGLPGLRAGFAVARGERREAMERARRPWNVGTPAAAVGAYCMRQDRFVAETRARVATERRRMRRALGERFEVHPSDAPFLLVDVGDRDVQALVATLRERAIAVRDATTFDGLTSHVRVAVRTPDENDRLLDALLDV